MIANWLETVKLLNLKKNKYGCQLWELVISTSSRQDVLLLLLAKWRTDTKNAASADELAVF